MIPQERKDVSDSELWKKIPIEKQFEIDAAIENGNKPLAVNRCMCAGVGFEMLAAIKFVELRKKNLPKRISNKKV